MDSRSRRRFRLLFMAWKCSDWRISQERDSAMRGVLRSIFYTSKCDWPGLLPIYGRAFADGYKYNDRPPELLL